MNTSHTLCIGIDNGGTKCTAIGRLISSQEQYTVTVPGGNPHDIGSEGTANRIVGAIQEIQKHFKVSAPLLMCFGTAGGGTPAMLAEITDHIQKKIHTEGSTISIQGFRDSDIALFDLFNQHRVSEAVLAIAGTGSMVMYKNQSQEEDRGRSGLGWVLSDPGSARSIGMRGTRLFRRLYVQNKTDSPFYTDMVAFLGGTDPQQIVHKSLEKPLNFFASIAPLMLQNYETESTIKEIITEEVAELVETIVSIQKNHPSNETLGLIGGLFSGFPFYAELVTKSIHAVFPNLTIITSGIEPARGALQHVISIAEKK